MVWQFKFYFSTNDDYLLKPSSITTITPAMFRGETNLITLMITCTNCNKVIIPEGLFLGTLKKITTIAPMQEYTDKEKTCRRDASEV